MPSAAATSRNYHRALAAIQSLMRPTNPTYTKLLSLVCQEPENHHRKIVLAEYLEDSDPELSEAWGWMASEGKRPRPWHDGTFIWTTFGNGSRTTVGSTPHCIFRLLQEIPPIHWIGSFGRRYDTVQAAYEAAATAYVAARRTGWRPEART